MYIYKQWNGLQEIHTRNEHISTEINSKKIKPSETTNLEIKHVPKWFDQTHKTLNRCNDYMEKSACNETYVW